ncbi:MAG: UDP-3-O-acyl-N-acetylglucosamine deacetylase [Alphaproteobacteria bacterium]|nr:UDP-3-O-acyl-N-acetylglucosamine deacetylase [Alphaproteobacteria bacterium]
MDVHQTTLRHAIECTGVGIHSGKPVRMVLRPGRPGTGIVFKRVDADRRKGLVPARFDLVCDTRLGTTLTNAHGVSVHTVEHLMSAFAGLGVDNAIVELDGPEIPIMDGSAAPFAFLIECAGVRTQDRLRRAIRILKKVTVRDGDKLAEYSPSERSIVDVEIEFASAAIARQHYQFDLQGPGFKTEVSRARTFGFRHEVEYLRAQGLARGGSLDNSVVVDGDDILNDGGLRYNNEFARHKLLDAIGDLRLAGALVLGRFRGVRCGHAINNALLRAVFADRTAYEVVTLGERIRRQDVRVEPAPIAAFAAVPA